LTPYYVDAERLLGIRTFECEPDLARILARLRQRGSDWQAQAMPLGLAADITAYPTEVTHFDGFASVRNLKSEAQQSFLGHLRGSGNFTLEVNAECAALLGHRDSPMTVAGVRLVDGRELRAPRIFLAAGALHSPRLLARYVRATGLEARLPAAAHVGHYLKLHLLTALVAFSATPKTDLIRKTMVLTCPRFAHSSVQPLGFDGALIATLIPKVVPAALRYRMGRHAYGFFLQTEDGSDPRNRVIESPQTGALPTLDYDETRLPAALGEHRRLNRAFRRALLGAGLVSFAQRIGLKGTGHACGTLICGRRAADSVVDELGRVHGLQGLYVVDGSVLPRSSRVNPSLTIYAWALRVAELAAREFQDERQSRPASSQELTRAL
jgi:choline dehydrogenase-like flavoprotein